MSYIKRKSKKQEDRTAKDFGGRVTPASGALDGCKGDVRTPLFLIENKFTDKDYYLLNAKIWDKIWKEATKDGLRIPIMQIDIDSLNLVVLNLYDFLEYCKEYKEVQSYCTDKRSFKMEQKKFGELRVQEYAVINLGSFDLAVCKLEDFKFELNNNC